MVHENSEPDILSTSGDPFYYDSPFVDETINKKYKRFSREIVLPDYTIAAISLDYLASRHSIFVIRKGYSKYTGHSVVIFDNSNNEMFSCKNKFFSNTSILYGRNTDAILNTKVDIHTKSDKFNINIKISDGTNDNSKYGTIKGHNTDTECIYHAEFKNIATGKNEILEIIGSKYGKMGYKYHSIYYFNSLHERMMIAKITRRSDLTTLTVEVAPGVDYSYILAIALALNRAFKNRK